MEGLAKFVETLQEVASTQVFLAAVDRCTSVRGWEILFGWEGSICQGICYGPVEEKRFGLYWRSFHDTTTSEIMLKVTIANYMHLT